MAWTCGARSVLTKLKKSRKEVTTMGGKPSKGTKKDMRLARNKPKPAAAPAKQQTPKVAKPGKMLGY